MKVYVLKVYSYCGGEPDIDIMSVSYTRETAVESIEKCILSDIEDEEYIIDENYKMEDIKNGKKDFIRVFYSFQENWDEYTEYEILEKEIVF